MNYADWYIDEAERSAVDNGWVWLPGMRVKNRPHNADLRYRQQNIEPNRRAALSQTDSDGNPAGTVYVDRDYMVPDLRDRVTQTLAQEVLSNIYGEEVFLSITKGEHGYSYDYATSTAYLLTSTENEVIPDRTLALAFALVPELESEWRAYRDSLLPGEFDWADFLRGIPEVPPEEPKGGRDMTKAA